MRAGPHHSTILGDPGNEMFGMKITILRYISDEPQPGIVECEFEDANGRCWSFVDKTAIVSAEQLDAQSTYPQMGMITVDVIGRGFNAAGQEVVRIDTERWGVETVEGTTRFEVLPESLVEG
jgi:hypothetical protein